MPEVEPITREEKLWSGEDIEPITREEQYIKHIYDKTQKIPSKPITRKKMLLEKAGEGGGSDVTIKQLSVTANGTYSEENTAYSPVIVNVPAPPIPDNAYLLNEVEGLSKDIVTFTDGASLLMPTLKVGIEPQQDLHGYDHPWVGGAGKNKLPLTVDGIKSANSGATWSGNSTTINNVTFTIQTDSDGNVKGINVNGTASGDSPSLYLYKNVTLSNDTYTLNGCPTNGSLQSYGLFVDYSSGGNIPDYGSGAGLPINNVTISARIRVQDGYNAQNLVFKPMIRLSSVTDATFEPYSNMCPISGHTEANVVVSPTTDAEDGQTYNIQFKDGDNPLTVYGSTLDVVSGELKVVPYYASYNGETLEGEWISDRDVYAVGTTPTIGAQVVNIGATPQSYQLTPTQVKSLLGTNNVWADTGDIEELEYFSKEA
jgi:hypothetical protein